MKVKTLKDNVIVFGDKKGSIVEVSQDHGEFLIKKGSAEEVKEKKTTKKTKKDGE
ncbi:hypothetical protein HV436_01440 [Bacillus sporothermodurans]|uniref:hypothetical protein n=1 Tax=Heyndrickxia sporothermodurans TaxID=46224 RepID=UPI00192C5B58|nr:hypothetical protein [Heyndrickxia sporothermodurans]MBL5776998.1 hypothetical protein [Heyndrickxia sporothermodurans]MBL5798526.1 hypothetical protein [Heyndrickxia sporothermodurans]MBL5809444.1 hypothetical protein [Heyndrickxia sporothermodurans]MBL5813078.1 hypothetical protein [Heyndrickxia sporothermodurans]MBL5816502.1 hypothetical protein [Heyndrickxia sporothermodurans]